jgi:hypothetical protein
MARVYDFWLRGKDNFSSPRPDLTTDRRHRQNTPAAVAQGQNSGPGAGDDSNWDEETPVGRRRQARCHRPLFS